MEQWSDISGQVPDTARHSMPLKEASQACGVSLDAMRKRLQRGIEEGFKGNDGRWRVYVNTDWPSASHVQDKPGQVLDMLLEQIRSRVTDKDMVIDTLTAQLGEKDATIRELLRKIPDATPTHPDQTAEVKELREKLASQEVMVRRAYKVLQDQLKDDV